MSKHLDAKGNEVDKEFFADTAMPVHIQFYFIWVTFINHLYLKVDVFHFNCKHTKADEYCQLHCNPARWNELLNGPDGNWVFNSLVAEQTNAWIVGYHSMLREMLAHNYEFFLDEMIMLRNASVIARLDTKKKGSIVKDKIAL